ncbi:MAG: signal peptidase I [Mariprofundaceae bacterium]
MSKKQTWRDWIESLLIVAIIAIVIRSFIIAPFKIPSSSMVPTLAIGDYIFVQRYPYGLRIPFTDYQFFPSAPERGDVVVFDYPEDRSKDYIKRIIGLPGDEIRYEHNKLFINGKEMSLEFQSRYTYFLSDGNVDISNLFQEQLTGINHEILRKKETIRDGIWQVPDGKFFVLGDNRNNSRDSRFWGFVPQSYLVGRAVIIWWSWDKFTSNVRWERLGSLVH